MTDRLRKHRNHRFQLSISGSSEHTMVTQIAPVKLNDTQNTTKSCEPGGVTGKDGGRFESAGTESNRDILDTCMELSNNKINQ